MRNNNYHGSLGQNVKVHFAGSDYDHNVLNSLEIAGVNYRLYTVYPAIVNKKPGDDLTDKTGVARRQQKLFKHVILDSGLFTLMFGSQKGQVQTMGMATCLLEIVIGVCDTPFLYLATMVRDGDDETSMEKKNKNSVRSRRDLQGVL